jgi:hypothetical protein
MACDGGGDDAVNVLGDADFRVEEASCKRVLCDKRALAHKSRGFVRRRLDT